MKKEDILEAIRPVQDPELKYSVVDLGLIYDVYISFPENRIIVSMTLTSPVCPMQDELKKNIINAVQEKSDIKNVDVEFVFDPPWSAEKATEEIQDEFILRGIPLSRF